MFKRNKKKINNSAKSKSQKNPKKKNPKLSKDEKKQLKEKRKQFKKKRNQYAIEGGIGGDKAPSTKRDVKTLFIFWAGVAFCVVGIVFFAIAYHGWSNHLKNNTSELGKALTFQKSDDASLNFNEVWTDKKRNVTVIKFGYDDSARKKLSTDGSDYKIYMKPKGTRPDAKISYGILNLEGDGYLFIKGKLKDQPYNMALENTLSLTSSSLSSSSVSDSTSSDSDDDEENLESVISSNNKDGSNSNIFFKNDDKEKDAKADIIKFTINPYSDTTKVYNGSFLNSAGEIDYSKVVSKTSVTSAVKRHEKALKPHKKNLENLEKSKPKYEEKVKKEKKAEAKKKSKKKDKDKSDSVDETSENETLLKENKEAIDQEKKEIEKREDEIDRIKNSRFDKSSFGDMQNKSTIY